MNHYQAPSSPTYHHQQLFSKNNRLYQQLLQDDYMTGQNYSKSTQSTSHVAHIKFNQPPITPVKLLKTTSATYQPQDSSPKLQKHISPFKVFQPSVGKMSNHATQSLSSNYCITEHENQENSTVNLYSLSKNQIQPDLDISSNNVTKKINQDESLNHNVTNVNVENILLEDSIIKQKKEDGQKTSQIIVLEDDKFKKYRSEQYSHIPYNLNESLDTQIEGKMPKILAQKHIKNQITKKFTISQHSENEVQSTFKAVLNEIHVVPYKINNEIRPYTFSVPVQNKESYAQSNTCITFPHHQEDSNKITTKANSLNLRHSNHSQYDNDEELGTTQNKNLYFSNHTHLNHNRANKNLGFSNPQIESHVKARQTPKSEPKYSQNCDKNARSNSIQCKSKPTIMGKEGVNSHSITKNPQLLRDGLDQSQVTKLFRNTNILPDDNIIAQQASVIYQSTALNICCSLNREAENHNKINFMRVPQQKEEGKLKYSSNQSPFFSSSIDMTKVSPLNNPKTNYKINPIHQIRQLNQNQGPKGIKLVGFPVKKQRS